MIKSIQEALARAEHVLQRDSTAFLTSREHKEDREAWILGHFTHFYNGLPGVDRLLYAERGDSRQIPSDFAVYAGPDPTSRICDIEIFEAMNPERRRGDEWKREPHNPLVEVGGIGGDTYRNLHRKIDDKYDKKRRSATWLLIYNNLYESTRQIEEGRIYQEAERAVARQKTPSAIKDVWILAGNAETARKL